MKYIIVGCGRVGSTLAGLLADETHDVSVIDENPAAFKRLGPHFPGRQELGTGIDADVLARAGARDADGFIAVTNGDNRNVMAALIAQRIFHVPKIIARIYDPPRGLLYRELGIDTICPTTIGAQIIRDRLLNVPFDATPTFDFGTVSSLTVSVGEGLAQKRVRDLEREGHVRVVAIRRGEDVLVATTETMLHVGDRVNLVVAPDSVAEFAQTYARLSTPVSQTA